MKVGLLLFSCVWAAWAAPQDGYNYPTPGGGGGGSGVFPSGGSGAGQYPSAPAQYTFQWDVNDPPSGNFYGHGEQRENDDTQGKYYVELPDGRRMVVEYYVDSAGYHPNVYFEGEITAGGGGGQYGQGGGRGQGGGGGGGSGQGLGQGYSPSSPGPSPGLPLPSQSYGLPSK